MKIDNISEIAIIVKASIIITITFFFFFLNKEFTMKIALKGLMIMETISFDSKIK